MVFTTGYLVVGITKNYRNNKEAEKRIQTLPETTFISMTGDSVCLYDFNPEKPMVIIYFHPECDHCHYEAREIGQNADVFNHCQLVMITFDDSLKRLKNFCNKYHLWEVNNFEILLDSDNHFQKIFGKPMIPSVYIYNVNRRLKKKYQGETKPEAIINEIRYK